MNRLSLDLELNEGDNKSIIQIGACIFNIETAEILDTFDQIIYQDEEITPFIINLTGITQKKVDAGKQLDEAYLDLLQFSLKHDCKRFPILVWGAGDLQALKKQISLKWELGYSELNVKSIYQGFCDANNITLQGGLKRSTHKMGLKFDGPAHNAEKDAVATAKMYCRLLEFFKSPK